MTQTAKLATHERLAKERRSLKEVERKIAVKERRVMEALSLALSGFGYRLAMANGGPPKVAPAGRARRACALPKKLKCPKCDRRFSLEMRIARHLSATHNSRQHPSADRSRHRSR